ncbi:MAG: ribonuclease III domain-containing protein [Candidatus Gastranaerophilales bacterium]|nr:ribonuclease III domain-containing protein [Candidatus Gastranaerophilales bacterium]
MDNRVTPDLRSFAHIGDAVWEVFIREITIYQTLVPNELHKKTIALVNAEFQAKLLSQIEPDLTEDEKAMAKRARNLSDGKSNRPAHRISTAFEVLIGYWYLNDKKRLDNMFVTIKELL